MASSRRGAVQAVRAQNAAHQGQQARELDLVRRVHVESLKGLIRALGRAFKGRMRDPATGADALRISKLAVQHGVQAWRAAQQALKVSLPTTIQRGVEGMHRALGQLRVPADFSGSKAADRARIELLEVRSRAVAAAGKRAGAALRAQLQLQPVAEQRVADAISTAAQRFDGESWRLARVARTEASRAFNASQVEAALDVEDIWLRWTELVSDLSGRPLDSKVALDSLAMHGQVAKPGGLFTMPAGGPSRMVGRSWQHPPNRPHDRAVLVPWRPGWGIPAWVVEDGRRKSLRSR